MKYKTTQKDILNSYDTVLKIGYCNAQFLLHYNSPFAYTCNGYGWKSDFYDFGTVAISTGYSPIGKAVDYNIVKKYDNAAQQIIYDYSLSYEQQKEKVTELLNAFIVEVI